MIKVSSSGNGIDKLLAKLRAPQPALEEIGKGLQQSTKDRIRTTKLSPDGKPFAPWSFSTLKARQKEGTAAAGILFRTGKLHESIQYQVVNNQVQVGADSSAPYAKYLQFGTMKMPARPFIGFSQQDLEMIRKILRNHIRKP